MSPADFKLPLHLAARNRARDYYNPLRGLDMPRLIRLLDAGERGEHADLQWLYRTVEKRDSTLRGLKMRRTSAIKKLDWDIKIPGTLPPGATPAMAHAQAGWLRSLYEGIENLADALEFLAIASFRGFAHLEKRFRDGNPALPLARLEPVPQWHWCRHPETWAWIYDAGAANNWSGGVAIDPDDFIIRELDDPINEVGAICFLRKNTSQKDWDAFVEDFGIPSIFAMLAEGTPPDKVKEWLDVIERVTGNSRGALPPGTKLETVAHGSQGETPFKQHKDEQREELVLAGTGGLLSMLTAPTGLNSGQADAHGKAFDEIAVAEGASISALLQAQIDQPALRREFPGQPACAYFQLAAVDTEDRAALGALVAQLKQAGLDPDAAEISEKTGLKLTKAPPQAAPESASATAFRSGPFANRAALAEGNQERFMAASAQRLADAGRAALAPLHERVAALAGIEDETAFAQALSKLRADLPALENQCLGDDATAQLEEAFSEIIGAALADGIASRAAHGSGLNEKPLKNNNPNRDDGGKFAPDGGDQTGGGKESARASAPKRITAAEADARLAKGETVKFKKKGLLNREGHFRDEPDGLPSVVVIRAIVAADRTADCPPDSTLPAKSQATKAKGRKESKTSPLPSRPATSHQPGKTKPAA